MWCGAAQPGALPSGSGAPEGVERKADQTAGLDLYSAGGDTPTLPHSTPSLPHPFHSVACGSVTPEGVEGGAGAARPVGPAGVAPATKGGPAEEAPLCHANTGWASRLDREGAAQSMLLLLQASFRGFRLRKRLAALVASAQVDLFEDGFAFPADTEELQQGFLEVG